MGIFAIRKDCGHDRPATGACPECHRLRSLDYWHRRGKSKRRVRDAQKARKRHAAVVRSAADVIALYRAERDRAQRQGKPTLTRRSA